MDITKKAMLVRLTISQWTARRKDDRASKHVINAFHAASNSGQFNKVLVDLGSIRKYQEVAGQARTFHYSKTLPWGDDDSRILPASLFMRYSKCMRVFKKDFEDAVAGFLKDYNNLVSIAKVSLNGLFNAGDYPGVDELKAKFGFRVDVLPIPQAEDFRVQMSEDEAAAVKGEIEQRNKEVIGQAMTEAWTRIYEAVKHIVQKLGNQKEIFRDSLIGNIRELCDVLPKLNITEDVNLAAVIEAAKKELSELSPDLLRKDERKRKEAAVKADEILRKMAGYTGGQK